MADPAPIDMHRAPCRGGRESSGATIAQLAVRRAWRVRAAAVERRRRRARRARSGRSRARRDGSSPRPRAGAAGSFRRQSGRTSPLSDDADLRRRRRRADRRRSRPRRRSRRRRAAGAHSPGAAASPELRRARSELLKHLPDLVGEISVRSFGRQASAMARRHGAERICDDRISGRLARQAYRVAISSECDTTLSYHMSVYTLR